MKNKQKAQGIVEFALVLPLFMFFFIGITYFGLVFSDYLTMSNTVRSVAHDASMQTEDAGYTTAITNNTKNVKLVSDIFVWNPGADTKVVFHPATTGATQNVVIVTATAIYNKDSYVGSVMDKMLDKHNGTIPKLEIVYSMYTTRKDKESE